MATCWALGREVSGTVARSYDDNFRAILETINGAFPVDIAYDDDSRIVEVGDEILTPDPINGFLGGTTVGNVTSSVTYNDYGEVMGLSYFFQGNAIYDVTYTRNEVGRIITKVETIEGTTTTRCFKYDTSAQLTHVFDGVDVAGCAGALVEEYGYGANNNRSYATNSAGVVDETEIAVDDQDRLLDYGPLRFGYTANGELALREDTVTGDLWDFDFDAMGNLVQVTLPSGDVIEYVTDARDRRVGKKVNGVLVQGFLYGDQLHPVAELDGTSSVVARFSYGSNENVPDYMIKNGATYRLLSDQLGSVVAVVDIATGSIVQRLEYDAWGRVLEDTHPGFQPFGFSGGLYDGNTGFARFGTRDYDPEVGRWIMKDPVGFSSRDENLYLYVRNDPINFADPSGLKVFKCSRPLEGFGSPDGQGWWPATHEWACVTLPDGSVRCESQYPSDDPYSSPGRPDNPKNDQLDPFSPANCEQVPEGDSCNTPEDDVGFCVEECIVREWNQPRPNFSLFGWWGVNCQEYTNDMLEKCTQECSDPPQWCSLPTFTL